MKRVVRLAGLVLSMWAGAIAQDASLSGIVSDPSGAVVAQARVTLTNIASRSTTTAATSTDGGYHLAHIEPGAYDLRIDAPGFAAYTKTNLAVRAGEQRSDAALQLASVEQAVDVGPRSAAARPRGIWQKIMGICKRP